MDFDCMGSNWADDPFVSAMCKAMATKFDNEIMGANRQAARAIRDRRFDRAMWEYASGVAGYEYWEAKPCKR